MHYWDTSALAKLYVGEADTAQFAAHLAATGPITTSELTCWELFRVIARKEAEGAVAVGLAETTFEKFLADVTAGGVRLIPMNDRLEERFRKLVLQLHRQTPHVFTRTLDAIHISTAELNQASEFVATDVSLRKCAVAVGLRVFP